MRRIASLMLSLVMAFSLVIASIGEVNAESKYQLMMPDNMWANDPSGYSVSAFETSTQNYYDAVKITTSNSKVIKVESYKYEGNRSYLLYAKKPGKAVIKVTIKLKNGTRKTLKRTVQVKKYPAPLKSLKVNGKAVGLSANKYQVEKKVSGSKVSAKVAPKSGWKIAAVYGHYYDKNWNMKDVKVTKTAVKKGTSISFPKKYGSMDIYVALVNSKGESFSYGIHFVR